MTTAKEGTIGLCGKGCLHLFHGGFEMVLVRTFLGGICPDGLLQTREELIVLRETFGHRACGQECQGDEESGVL